MLTWIIDKSTRHNGVILALVALLVLSGWISLQRISIDAIPDLTDTQVIVYSTWDVSPDIMEDQVTYPIVSGLLAVPGVRDIRGFSDFGASFVYIIFEDGTDIYWARSRVLEYLANITPRLPEEVQTQLGPDATGVGWIYQYVLTDSSGQVGLEEMRSFQDWFLRYQLQSVPGVAEVASFGGGQKQFQIQVNPEKLRLFNIPIRQVAEAVRSGNSERGARVLEFSGTEYMVRLRGYAKNLEDIENIVVASDRGIPIYVKNIANVVLAPEIRRGVGDYNGYGDAVGGIVVMRYGENANAVIERVKKRIAELKTSFPEGVELIETYDRSELIQSALYTLKSKTIVEMLVVAFVILFFLLHFSSSMVPILVLPTAVVMSFIPMLFMGVSANIMSMGGIIISIGAMVDAAIVVVENCHKKIDSWKSQGRVHSQKEAILTAIKEVAPASFYSLLVISVSFLPIFALEAQEGKLFHPLAYTKTFVMMIAAVLSITFVPALLVLLGRDQKFSFRPIFLSNLCNRILTPLGFKEEDHAVSRALYKLYSPCVRFVVEHKWKTVVFAYLMVVLTLPVFFKLGSEFMPPLNEGTILYMPTTLPGISASEAQALLQKQDEILASFPEVKSVHGKAGRADTATDPAPLSMMETVIVLRPQNEWRRKERWYSFLPDFLSYPFTWLWPREMSWEELIAEMDKAMQFPGLTNAWTMPIKGRIDMLTTGIRTPLGLKISGSDLEEISRIGEQVERVLQEVEGTRSVFAERVTGGYFLDIDFKREALARYGIGIEQAARDVELALGGMNISTTVMGRERYPIQVRYARGFRGELEDLKQILLESPRGYTVPLGSVASLTKTTGPGMIRNENGLLTGYVFIDLETTDFGSYVEKARSVLDQSISLPPGYSLVWSGQFESMDRVKNKLQLLIPLTLLLVAVLMFLNTGSWVKTGMILFALPFSAIGAIWLLYLLDFHLSVAVWVGIIALLGVDAETSIYMLLYLDMSHEDRKKRGLLNSVEDLKLAIHEGAVQRIRPKMMTVVTTFLGLMPVLLATTSATGADVMKRMVAPMIGGIFTSFLLELLVFPALFAIWKEQELLKRSKGSIIGGSRSV